MKTTKLNFQFVPRRKINMRGASELIEIFQVLRSTLEENIIEKFYFISFFNFPIATFFGRRRKSGERRRRRLKTFLGFWIIKYFFLICFRTLSNLHWNHEHSNLPHDHEKIPFATVIQLKWLLSKVALSFSQFSFQLFYLKTKTKFSSNFSLSF